MSAKPLGWLGIARLGLVQSSLGAIVALTTSTLNRVMVVEFQLAAMVPAGLVAWHYAVQLSRPRWGHGSDRGGRRTPWILGGMGVLVLGALLAADAAILMAGSPLLGGLLGFLGFSMIGAGVGAAGTSLLALLAARTAPERRPAAAALTWILMILGIVVTAGVAGQLLDPFSPQRLALVASGVALCAFLLTFVAVAGVEPKGAATSFEPKAQLSFRAALADVWRDQQARQFSIFVFVSMLAYSMQDLILEPFAGLLFAMTPGESTQLGGMQHLGVLLGMILVGAVGARLGGHKAIWMRGWTAAGCFGSALALAGLALASSWGPGWPLPLNVFLLGFANGMFAVAAIGSMMGLAGAGGPGKEGMRMGLWGAAQAVAFGLGGLLGALGVDVLRAAANTPLAFSLVFSTEAALFLLSMILALRLAGGAERLPALPAGEQMGDRDGALARL